MLCSACALAGQCFNGPLLPKRRCNGVLTNAALIATLGFFAAAGWYSISKVVS